MKTITSIAAITLTALLTSCGGSESDKGSKDEATSTTWTLERSEKEWDASLLKYDEGFTPIGELEDQKSKDVAAWNAACKGFAEALRENAEKAKAGKWPGELKGKMDRFAPLLEAERKGVVDCQNAKTMKDVEAGLRAAERESATTFSAGTGIQHYFEEEKAKK